MNTQVNADRPVRAIKLLQTVADANAPITANELSERSGVPKATVYRLCEQLLDAGLIQRQLGGRGYLPGPQLVGLAQSVLASQAVRLTHHAILERIAREIGETCNLVAPERTGMIYWDRVETEWPLRLQLPIGTRVPFHATASGKMYLACLNADHCDRLLAEIELREYTDRTLNSKELLRAHLQQIRERGYSLDDEEFITGMTAVAVPVHDARGRYMASLAVHAPKFRMSIADASGHVATLRQAAAQIGASVAGENKDNQ